MVFCRACYSIFDILGLVKLFVYTAFWRNSDLTSQPMQFQFEVPRDFQLIENLGLQYT